jgi:hypothetical protein
MSSNSEAQSPEDRSYRMAVVPERYGQVLSPCASIRIASFFESMRHSHGLQMRFLLPEELRRYKPDLVVWHRVSMPDMRSLDELEDVARESGTRLVYDLDDNLLDLDNHGEKGQYRPMTAIVRRSRFFRTHWIPCSGRGRPSTPAPSLDPCACSIWVRGRTTRTSH